MKKRWKILCLLLLACVLFYLHRHYHLTVDAFLAWQPENLFLTAMLLLLLFAVKSTLVFIPIMLPQILVGHLYPRDMAIFLNMLGLAVVMATPYWIGKKLGSAKMEQLIQKYPKIQKILTAQDDNQMAVCFMLRACAVPPADIVTMYLGTTGMPFVTNVIGGVLGSFPSMLLTTFLGANIRNPESPAFWQALILNIAWIVLSGLGFYLFKKSAFREGGKSVKPRRFPKWLRKLFRRRMLIAFLIVLQAVFIIYLVASRSMLSQRLSRLLQIISILVVLYIVSKRDKGAYKTLWVFLILCFPIFGGLLYLLVTFQTATRIMCKEIRTVREQTKQLYFLPGDGYDSAKEITGSHFPQVRYLQDYVGYPVYSNTRTTYLCPGEAFQEHLLLQLEKAEHYIFLEFFIVQEGYFWDSIFTILKRKAAEGVIVRLIYDDLGCFFVLPTDFAKQMVNAGIQCAVFNPFRPFLTVKQNNRDHRKIVVIDGKAAFTGGINLADEYINAYEKYGHWKDSAIMLEGKAAWSFTLMFLEMWQLCKKCDEDIASYYPWQFTPCDVEPDGLVQPYADSPMDNENVGEHVYLQILNEAKDYVYINTPYLIVDDSMVSALCLAAKRGVDVRIVTPHRWDKWFVHMTTRSYYRELIRAGVKVYEYSNGFIHSKSFVSDDVIATVGTTNLDFRSLYLHFECGTWMYGSRAVMQVKQDFLNTLPVCQRIEEKDCARYLSSKLFQEILRLFAPLM